MLRNPSPTSQSSNSSTDVTESQQSSSSQFKKISFTGNQQALEYIPILQDDWLSKHSGEPNTPKQELVKFYKVGSADNNDLILAQINFGDDHYPPYFLFVKQPNQYIILQKHSSFNPSEYTFDNESLLVSNAITDNSTIIPALEAKESISFNGITASKATQSLPIILDQDRTKDMTEVAKIDQGTVYEQVVTNSYNKGIKNMAILLKQPTGLYVTYRYTTDIIKDDKSVAISLSDGSSITKKYDWAMIHGGCGMVDNVNVLDKAYINDLKEIGKSGQEPIYGFKTADSTVINTIYEAYNSQGGREGAVSKEQFWKDNGVIVVKNKLGYRVVLVNADYQRQGECGKPVIYLYPEQKTDVNVEVGAKVTVSEPTYHTGWNVTAYPDSSIFNKQDGKTYPYLFWEGQGYGKYPQITKGFVVKRQDVEQTLRTHLSRLGLNQQESADFLEFWLPHMPNKPYIRLSWLDTQQMNELAPLKLSVRPDTTIRVFLDAQGLDRPINIQPQSLTHPERKGFTLVEWGGLLYK